METEAKLKEKKRGKKQRIKRTLFSTEQKSRPFLLPGLAARWRFLSLIREEIEPRIKARGKAASDRADAAAALGE